VTASDKRAGFEGLNQRVTDLNAFVKQLRGENRELQAQIDLAKKVMGEELAKKEKEVGGRLEKVKREHKEEKRAINENHQRIVE
jgi:CRISPR/Cas system CMR-associated protein Cmr3 (group 5 of RAMP superfamily)